MIQTVDFNSGKSVKSKVEGNYSGMEGTGYIIKLVSNPLLGDS